MKVIVKHKNFGDRNWVEKEIEIDDSLKPFLAKLSLEVVSYPLFDACVFVYFNGENTDVISFSINRFNFTEKIYDKLLSLFHRFEDPLFQR